MVTLAHLIVSSFSDIAYCPGTNLKTVQFPEDISVLDAEGNIRGKLKDFRDHGVLAFVSDDCPVSMIETVIKSRKLAKQGKDAKLIVAPLQKISTSHLAMRRMVAVDNYAFCE